MKKIIKLLGLKAIEGQQEVSEDQIADSVSALIERATAGEAMQKQAAKIRNQLGLGDEATFAEVASAIAALKESAADSTALVEREQKISALILKTGMQRTDAEHTIDQQAKEDAARAKAATKK